MLPCKDADPLGHPVSYHSLFRLSLCLLAVAWTSGAARPCSVVWQGSHLDAASKVHVAPLVFEGRLLRVNVQYPIIRTTFRVKKFFKRMHFIKDKKTNIVVEFSVKSDHVPPKRGSCQGVKLDPNELRVKKKYIVFAATRRLLSDPVKEQSFIGVARPEPHVKRKAISRAVATTATRPSAKISGKQEVQLRSRLRLKCEAAGNPLPRIRWYKNGIKLKRTNRIRVKYKKRYSRLVIQRVNHDDGGEYTCNVKNVISQTDVSTTVLIMSNTPKPTNDSNIWPLGGSRCPVATYCLNGGFCSYYEAIGEYVSVQKAIMGNDAKVKLYQP